LFWRDRLPRRGVQVGGESREASSNLHRVHGLTLGVSAASERANQQSLTRNAETSQQTWCQTAGGSE
jgi:hypothetical protein